MNDFGLGDLDITTEELNRFTKAFRNDEFKKLFAEYCAEINDPANKKKYEEELTQLEAERGIEVTFINPEPGFVIKTSVNGNQKAFINVAKCGKVKKPSSTCGTDSSGHKGLSWSIPYTQSSGHRDVDNKGAMCMVYDVVFHPDTLHLADKNAQFRKLVIDTSCDAVRTTNKVEIDVANLKFPKIKYKGYARPTIIRKEMKNPPKNLEPSPIDKIYPPLPNKNQTPGESVHETIPTVAKYTIPKYKIIHRRDVQYHELTNELDSKINLTIPSDLIVKIDLPLLSSTNEVTLDVTARKIYLISETPAKYKLHLDLPYEVSESDSSAKFDKAARKLTISLPVLRKRNLTISDICRDDSGVESDHGSPKEDKLIGSEIDVFSKVESNGKVLEEEEIEEVCEEDSVFEEKPSEIPASENTVDTVTNKVNTFLDTSISYEFPQYTCNTLENTVAFTLQVKNTDPKSIDIQKEDSIVHIKFTSIGSGYFPINYAFMLKFSNDNKIFNAIVDPWDNNVILQIELENLNFESYLVGVDESDLKEMKLKKHITKLINFNNATEDNPLNVEVHAVSDKEVKIEITNNNSNHDSTTDQEQQSTTVQKSTSQKTKKNKRKSKKVRSLSESNFVDLKDSNEAIKTNATTQSIDIKNVPAKARSLSESSNDDQVVPKIREFKSILKRRSSFNRSISESSVDDQFYSCPLDLAVGSIQEESANELSESCKKHVRFDNNIQKQLYRIRSTIIGQRKPKPNKRNKKKRTNDRRYSEGEASDYEAAKANDTSDTKDSPDNKAQVLQHDSGIDLTEGNVTEVVDFITKPINIDAQHKLAKKDVDGILDLQFKSGMIFDIEM